MTITKPNIEFKAVPDIANAYSISIPSPDGTVIVHCTENERGQLKHVIINIGKTGLSLRSWSDALSRMINLVLKHEDVNSVLAELSNITTGKSVFHSSGIHISSAPQAVFAALVAYKNAKAIKNERPTFVL